MTSHSHHRSSASLAVAPAATAHAGHGEHGGHDHEAMIADFRRRLVVSLVLTLPILALSPMIQHWLGLADRLAFPGDIHVLAALSSVVYFYGGWPFLQGIGRELAARQPGMMTLIALAISVAYFYSTAVVLGLPGEPLYWELATLIDVMLLGHWIEMRSVLGASRALESLVRLLPATALCLRPDGGIEEVAVGDLVPGDRVLVRPGEKVPIDGRIEGGRSHLNEAMLTGESRPIERGPGEEAIGGALNGEGALTLLVQKTTPAVGAALMSLSTIVVAINAKLLERAHALVARDDTPHFDPRHAQPVGETP